MVTFIVYDYEYEVEAKEERRKGLGRLGYSDR